MNPLENIRMMITYAQTLQHDGIIYWSGEPTIATDERKSMVCHNINLIKKEINTLEQILSTGNNE